MLLIQVKYSTDCKLVRVVVNSSRATNNPLPSEYTTEPQHTDTVLGYPLTLTCEVHDNPSSLIFYHNDTELVTGVTTDNNLATLKVEEVELAAAGLYHCGAVYAPSLQTLGSLSSGS